MFLDQLRAAHVERTSATCGVVVIVNKQDIKGCVNVVIAI